MFCSSSALSSFPALRSRRSPALFARASRKKRLEGFCGQGAPPKSRLNAGIEPLAQSHRGACPTQLGDSRSRLEDDRNPA